ncbi:MAG: hypothetical protein EBX52_08900 [Proteobacteria bacterium]|nr:hypothetical protein [Pseudomonadota bacterium]
MRLLILVFSFGVFSQIAFAQDSGSRSAAFGWASKRADVRAQTRWSLDEWLKQRERMRWSDLWLQMNAPSPYEFFVTGSYNLVPDSMDSSRNLRYGAGAYVTAFGLEFEHASALSMEDHVRFHFRFFGNSIQNTNLTAHFGVRRRTDAEVFLQWYLGIDGQIYLTKYLGFTQGYRYHLKSIPTRYGSLFGHRFELGPFLDYGPLRVFVKFMTELESRTTGATGASGWSSGIQLFW